MRPPTGSRLVFPSQDATSPSCFNFCTALGTAGLHPESHKSKNALKLAFVPRTARGSVEAELIPVSRLAEEQRELPVRRQGVDVQTHPCSIQMIFYFHFFLFANALEIPVSQYFFSTQARGICWLFGAPRNVSSLHPWCWGWTQSEEEQRWERAKRSPGTSPQPHEQKLFPEPWLFLPAPAVPTRQHCWVLGWVSGGAENVCGKGSASCGGAHRMLFVSIN